MWPTPMRSTCFSMSCSAETHSVPKVSATRVETIVSDLQSALSAAVDALGEIMLEMQRRKLLSEGKFKMNTPMYEKAIASALTDEQIGTIAANAFEAGTMAMAAVGHPGAAVFSCNGVDRSGHCDGCGQPHKCPIHDQ